MAYYQSARKAMSAAAKDVKWSADMISSKKVHQVLTRSVSRLASARLSGAGKDRSILTRSVMPWVCVQSLEPIKKESSGAYGLHSTCRYPNLHPFFTVTSTAVASLVSDAPIAEFSSALTAVKVTTVAEC